MDREKGKNAVINLNEEDENCESFSSSEEEFISSETIEKNYPVDDMDEEVMNMVFDTEEDAYEFYNLYGKLTGFGIKRQMLKLVKMELYGIENSHVLGKEKGTRDITI